ncbi:MAG: divalent-cation tolerance protein CutA [Verrucomicrobiae bacterium]|nr:divalent-cation tolerance protein CutA [Verrucomicrobiae bacterium]
MAQTQFRLVLVTAPNLKTARHLAKLALSKRLIACANLLPQIESHYLWQGRLERSFEVLLLLKTVRSRVPALQRLILEAHPYDTPEFVVLNITAGAKRYLDWVRGSCA